MGYTFKYKSMVTLNSDNPRDRVLSSDAPKGHEKSEKRNGKYADV